MKNSSMILLFGSTKSKYGPSKMRLKWQRELLSLSLTATIIWWKSQANQLCQSSNWDPYHPMLIKSLRKIKVNMMQNQRSHRNRKKLFCQERCLELEFTERCLEFRIWAIRKGLSWWTLQGRELISDNHLQAGPGVDLLIGLSNRRREEVFQLDLIQLKKS